MKKGFTLIELLAVIVILAIIALIATPIVLNIINDTKESATLRSAEFYLDALELSIAQSVLENKHITDGTYNVLENGNICLEYKDTACKEELEIEVNGETPENGVLIIENGKIYSLTLKYDNKTISKYKDGELSYIAYKPGDVVYFDVKEGIGCTEENYKNSWDATSQDYLNSTVGYNGVTSSSALQNNCLKFYVTKDLGGALDLLLDHDLGMQPWAHSVDYGCINDWDTKNDKGPITVLKGLYDYTKEWNGTEKPLNYTLNQKDQVSNANYTIDYNGYNARLITAQEIAEITGNITWDETTSYYFTSLTTVQSLSCSPDDCITCTMSGCKFGWLYDRTNDNCKTYGCLNNNTGAWTGYFTATAAEGSTDSAWYVDYRGQLSSTLIYYSMGVQIRPVITITKDKLN